MLLNIFFALLGLYCLVGLGIYCLIGILFAFDWTLGTVCCRLHHWKRLLVTRGNPVVTLCSQAWMKLLDSDVYYYWRNPFLCECFTCGPYVKDHNRKPSHWYEDYCRNSFVAMCHRLGAPACDCEICPDCRLCKKARPCGGSLHRSLSTRELLEKEKLEIKGKVLIDRCEAYRKSIAGAKGRLKTMEEGLQKAEEELWQNFPEFQKLSQSLSSPTHSHQTLQDEEEGLKDCDDVSKR